MEGALTIKLNIIPTNGKILSFDLGQTLLHVPVDRYEAKCYAHADVQAHSPEGLLREGIGRGQPKMHRSRRKILVIVKGLYCGKAWSSIHQRPSN